jgi:hypothetical protein
MKKVKELFFGNNKKDYYSTNKLDLFRSFKDVFYDLKIQYPQVAFLKPFPATFEIDPKKIKKTFAYCKRRFFIISYIY